MPAALAGLNILVTRPEHQAQALCQLLEQHGAQPLLFPLIDIRPLSQPDRPERDHYDVVIFVSNNAVLLGIPLIKPLLTSAKIATVGEGTARVLQQQGYPVDILPEEQFDSEGLLAHPALQNVNGLSVLIVRGEGGRPLLGETLQQRGAQVDYLAAYQRCLPEVDQHNLLFEALQNNRLDIILISSGEALQNLLSLTGKAQLDKLLDIQLAVTHPRQAEKAKALGFKKTPIISQQPGDQSLIDALIQWRNP
ncbi:MAG: uroporphyrinogen-III synthase [Thioalkalispiraceae bacterium]|jgi:uroporphyrinogen-III synthase